ncbi:MAG: hypothetical protein ACFFC7_20340 [Candidatus Hermodarchaeota archaeon]
MVQPTKRRSLGFHSHMHQSSPLVCGDGSFTPNEIIFSTDNFHLTDVMRLALALRRTVGVKTDLFWRPLKYKFGTTEPLSPEELT